MTIEKAKRAEARLRSSLREAALLRAVAPLVLVAALSCPDATLAFDKQLGVGAGGGYSQLFRSGSSDPLSAHGVGATAHISFGLTDTFGITFAGGMAWFGGYVPVIPASTTDENGDPITEHVNGPEISELTVWDLEIGGLYAIDVSRVVPYFELGAVLARVAEKQAAAEVVDLEVGMRICLGFDYLLLEHMSIGAAVGMDTFFTGQSQYGSRFLFLARLTVVWDLRELGRGDDTE